ncbi:hypothetical protein M595_1509 [Lyngbya aestuarii BL J]|uniref:DUF2079 domain-containing protein n=1 Tax=Lyngbya aestuarii BL J TaxID=1348334 RepID=U7QKP8_9CYAN|nr:DUF2079 domain-containing protein [Lyngbya aestuarii]ERT08443.1 hypothetical protein M595_1509 [Lyngbya aestuarii BL J]
MQISPEPSSSTKSQNWLPPSPVLSMIAGASAIFWICSSLRHWLFQSTGYDLGIYDQVTYLISQGQPPISSILGFHHLGNHGAWAVYPLGLLYKVYPSVYLLLLLQAIVLALGIWPTWSLARLAGLSERLSLAIAAVYILYPVVFNINLFDFHPEVMALPALLAAVLAAKLRQILWFSVAIIWVLGCKAVLSLTILALGFWLLIFEKRRICGTIALLLGMAWFVVVTQVMIPNFSGREVEGVWRYTYLGNSVLEILVNLILKPYLVLGRLISLSTLDYLYQLFFPVIWWLSPLSLTALVPAIPTILINSLSDVPFQRSLAFQYSIPVLPFLLVAIISSLEHHGSSLGKVILKIWQKLKKTEQIQDTISFPNYSKLPQLILIWSLIVFLMFGKYGRFWVYFNRLDTWNATREAITLVQPRGNVLTDNRLAPHFTHRPVVKLLSQVTIDDNFTEFDYIVLNLRHPWPDTENIGQNIANKLTTDPRFQALYQQDDVFVFQQTTNFSR